MIVGARWAGLGILQTIVQFTSSGVEKTKYIHLVLLKTTFYKRGEQKSKPECTTHKNNGR